NAIDAQPFTIVSGGNSILNPQVAFNGSEYLVVWGDTNQIYGKRVGAHGAVLDASPIPLMPGRTPAVAALGSTFLVADVNTPTNPHIQNTFVARVKDVCTVMDASPSLHVS